MKPLPSTYALINYAWWSDFCQSIISNACKFEMHKRPEQFQCAADQALFAAFTAGDWLKTWRNETYAA